MKTLGIILIVLGIAMFFIPSISFQTEESLVDVGPIEVSKTKDHELAWPNYAGGISIAAGVILIFVGRKK
jgi:uncharacterized protein YjeT (DUF2065 family)